MVLVSLREPKLSKLGASVVRDKAMIPPAPLMIRTETLERQRRRK